MTAVTEITADSIAHYTSVLEQAAHALKNNGVEAGREVLNPIAGQTWMGKVSLAATPKLEGTATTTRSMSDGLRAKVFKRDSFTCSACSGKTVPRSILVAFHDIYPEAIPYHANYKRGFIHPVFWALAPEADHVHAHSKGGDNSIENLTTLHAICNTRKSDSIAVPRAHADKADESWDGLTSFYSTLIENGAGALRSKYHRIWNSRYSE